MNPSVPFYGQFSKQSFTNMWIYIAGIVFYKFALETMNTCIFNLMSRSEGDAKHVALLWTVLQSINYATQCLGSLAVAPLIRRFRTNYVQAIAIACFGVTIAIIPILEVATGGTRTVPGKWTPLLLFAIFPVVGFFHGCIELIRRIIPNDIVGGNEANLKRMDSSVHIIYEIAGTTGALCSTYWITYFSFAYALFFLPISFGIACVLWLFIRLPPPILQREKAESSENLPPVTSLLEDTKSFFSSFFYSVYVGGKLIFTNRSLIWLIPAYTLPLVLHRYIENTLFPFYAKFVLKKGALSQILLGGSNFGELIGAFLVLILADRVYTPLPWLRSDAFTLQIIWVLAYATPYADVNQWAWALFPAMSFLSMGWASGDVSLAAYVQARLSHLENKEKHTSPLGAVMSFLYVSYIILFPILASGMGVVMDVYKTDRPQEAFIYIGGVFLTICGLVIFLSTFIPKGSFRFNPNPKSEEFDTAIYYKGEVIKQLTEEEMAKQETEGGNMVELVAGA